MSAEDLRRALSGHFGRMHRRPVVVPAKYTGGEPITLHLAALTPEISARLEARKRDKAATDSDLAVEVVKLMVVDPETGKRIFGDDTPSDDFLRRQVTSETLGFIAATALGQTPGDALGN